MGVLLFFPLFFAILTPFQYLCSRMVFRKENAHEHLCPEIGSKVLCARRWQAPSVDLPLQAANRLIQASQSNAKRKQKGCVQQPHPSSQG